MALRYALLATLHERPATGYELTQKFKTRLANVWNASHQQIYQELGKLHHEKFLLAEDIQQKDKPNKKRYHLTLAGRSVLEAWLNTPQPRPATRDPLLVKLFAGDLLELGKMSAELEALKQDWVGQLGYYRVVEHTYFRAPASLPRRDRLQHLALRRGMLTLETDLKWLDEVVANIHNPD